MSEPSPSSLFPFPPLGMGCMSLPEEHAAAQRVIHAALASGIRFFDTADLYQKGKNEETLGRAIQSRRPDLILATKVGNEWNEAGTAWSWNPTKAYIIQAVEASLRRLRTDYLDLYQLHGGTIDDPWEETLEAFELLKSQGKIRAFGISSIRPNVIRKVLAMSNPATIMMQYNPLDRRPEETIFPFLKKTATRVLVRGAFAKGLLIDKPPTDFLDLPQAKVKEVKAAIQEMGYTSEAVLIRFGLMEKAVGSLIVGLSSVDQVAKLQMGREQSLGIKEEEILELKRKFTPNLYQDHR